MTPRDVIIHDGQIILGEKVPAAEPAPFIPRKAQIASELDIQLAKLATESVPTNAEGEETL